MEAYSNMIVPIVDALKCLSFLAFDCLLFVLIEQLAAGREKLKDDGQNVSMWLSALAAFSGHLAKKYYRHLNLAPLLQYVACQLMDNQTLDLLVLKEARPANFFFFFPQTFVLALYKRV